MRALSGTEDPLETIATEIARDLRLLAFDEFHVSDIADAMILARLLELLIAKGVVLVMTSNYRPDDLYPHGLQRSRFLPAIEILKNELDVVELDGNVDHRQRLLDSLGVYYTPLDAAAEEHLARLFEAMTKAGYAQDGAISVGGRDIAFRRRAKGVIWFEFAELFEKARSQVDYLEIASSYHTVLVSHVRRMRGSTRCARWAGRFSSIAAIRRAPGAATTSSPRPRARSSPRATTPSGRHAASWRGSAAKARRRGPWRAR